MSKTKSLEPDVVTELEWEVPERPPVAFGSWELVSNGAAVLAPQTPNAVTVKAVCWDMTSVIDLEASGPDAIA